MIEYDKIANYINHVCAHRKCRKHCLRNLAQMLACTEKRRAARMRTPCAPRAARFLRGLFARLRGLFTAVLLSTAICSYGALDVQWINDSVVVVSGYGSGGSEGDTPVVVTNVVGVCTNCIDISVQEFKDGVADIKSDLTDMDTIYSDVYNHITFIEQICTLYQSDIVKFQTFTVGSNGTIANIPTWTSYITSEADNTQKTLLHEHIINGNYTGLTNSSSTAVDRVRRGKAVGYNNGVYDYANEYVLPFIGQIENQKYTLATKANQYQTKSTALATYLQVLSDTVEPCTNVTDYVGVGSGSGSGSGDGSGSGSGANTCACREQLEQIGYYVDEIELYMRNQLKYLTSISNDLSGVKQKMDEYGHSIVDALYSSYTHLPQQLDWQRTYLVGESTAWGYEPTNILQRIETLLYGISGLSTNDTDFTSVSDDTTQQSFNVSDQIIGMQTDATGDGAQSFGSAVIGIVRTLGNIRRTPIRPNQQLTFPYRYYIGNDSYDVPAITFGTEAYDLSNAASICRSVLVIIYSLTACWLVFSYWAWFSRYAIRFVKWATDILNGIFAS